VYLSAACHHKTKCVYLQGWVCNNSICLTKRGLKPTGIAIWEAQEQGFLSVAHHLQVSTHLVFYCDAIQFVWDEANSSD